MRNMREMFLFVVDRRLHPLHNLKSSRTNLRILQRQIEDLGGSFYGRYADTRGKHAAALRKHYNNYRYPKEGKALYSKRSGPPDQGVSIDLQNQRDVCSDA